MRFKIQLFLTIVCLFNPTVGIEERGFAQTFQQSEKATKLILVDVGPSMRGQGPQQSKRDKVSLSNQIVSAEAGPVRLLKFGAQDSLLETLDVLRRHDQFYQLRELLLITDGTSIDTQSLERTIRSLTNFANGRLKLRVVAIVPSTDSLAALTKLANQCCGTIESVVVPPRDMTHAEDGGKTEGSDLPNQLALALSINLHQPETEVQNHADDNLSNELRINNAVLSEKLKASSEEVAVLRERISSLQVNDAAQKSRIESQLVTIERFRTAAENQTASANAFANTIAQLERQLRDLDDIKDYGHALGQAESNILWWKTATTLVSLLLGGALFALWQRLGLKRSSPLSTPADDALKNSYKEPANSVPDPQVAKKTNDRETSQSTGEVSSLKRSVHKQTKRKLAKLVQANRRLREKLSTLQREFENLSNKRLVDSNEIGSRIDLVENSIKTSSASSELQKRNLEAKISQYVSQSEQFRSELDAVTSQNRLLSHELEEFKNKWLTEGEAAQRLVETVDVKSEKPRHGPHDTHEQQTYRTEFSTISSLMNSEIANIETPSSPLVSEKRIDIVENLTSDQSDVEHGRRADSEIDPATALSTPIALPSTKQSEVFAKVGNKQESKKDFDSVLSPEAVKSTVRVDSKADKTTLETLNFAMPRQKTGGPALSANFETNVNTNMSDTNGLSQEKAAPQSFQRDAFRKSRIPSAGKPKADSGTRAPITKRPLDKTLRIAVPIRVDALVVKNSKNVVEPSAEYYRLPFVFGGRDRNAGTANLAEEIVSQPFENINLTLPPGVHLHWALPDALCRGRASKSEGLNFPAVPNRWLVTRRIPGKATKTWMVESDFLYPVGGMHPDSTCIPQESFTFSENDRDLLQPFLLELANVETRKQEPAVLEYLLHLKRRAEQKFGDIKQLHDQFGVLGITKSQGFDDVNRFLKEKQIEIEEQVLRELLATANRLVLRSNGRRYFLIPEPSTNAKNDQRGQIESVQVRAASKFRVVADDELVEFLNSFLTEEIDLVQDLKSELPATKFPSSPDEKLSGNQFANANRFLLEKYFPGSLGRIPKQPFRFMGRALPIETWMQNTPTERNDYLGHLTAVGNQEGNHSQIGEPTFNAFYPNCRNVFGFCDEDLHGTIPPGLSYEVVGFYELDSPDRNPLRHVHFRIDRKKLETKDFQQNDLPPALRFLDHFQHKLGWTIPLTISPKELFQLASEKVVGVDPAQIVELLIAWGWLVEIDDLLEVVPPSQALKNPEATRNASHPAVHVLGECMLSQLAPFVKQFRDKDVPLVCVGKITFDTTETSKAILDTPQFESPSISVGHTGTEALAAFVAKQLSDDQNSRAIIEEQLESVQIMHNYDQRALDIGSKFKEERHRREFLATQNGTRWIVSTLRDSNQSEPSNQAVSISDLPDFILAGLDELNSLQRQFDQATRRIKSKQKQLFSDWHKYMKTIYPPELSKDEYPDVDEIKHFVELQSAELQRLIDQTGNIKIGSDENGGFKVRAAGTEKSLAKTIEASFSRLESSIEALAAVGSAHGFKLQPVADSRFWQPREPVVAITGEAATATLRHGNDRSLTDSTFLRCELFRWTEGSTDFENVINRLEANYPSFVNHWKRQPWHPILLEWKVEFHPLDKTRIRDPKEDSATSGGNQPLEFQPDGVASQFEMRENDVILHSTQPLTLHPNTVEISGRCILTPYANKTLQLDLVEYLTRQISNEYLSTLNNTNSKGDTNSASNQGWLDGTDRLDAVLSWYESKLKGSALKSEWWYDPVYTAIRSLRFLQSQNCLSQALGGFNEALLQNRQILQLQIDDPIAFKDYAEVTQTVRNLVQDSIAFGPLPENEFVPLRCGTLKLNHLRLIDSFGQTSDVLRPEENAHVAQSQQMLHPDFDDQIWLAPRLVQPVRLDFQWLKADTPGEDPILNSLSSSNPICGWLLPNNLDGSLMIYNQKGEVLGAITTNFDQPWQAAPGHEVVKPNGIENVHLQNFVTAMLDKIEKQKENQGQQQNSRSFLEEFILSIDQVLESIEPENFAQNQARALLIGRPIALVRASINLAIDGEPAIDQSWGALHRDMESGSRSTLEYEKLEFPIRVGEYEQANDGLIGFWRDKDGGFESEFHVNDVDSALVANPEVRNDRPLDEKIKPRRIEIINYLDETSNKVSRSDVVDRFGSEVWFELIEKTWLTPLARTPAIMQSIASHPETISILMDPRGSIHANCGILPTKEIRLADSLFASSLKNIEVTFLTSPILTNEQQIQLSLPDEQGFAWSWLERSGPNRWREVSAKPKLEKRIFVVETINAKDLWAQLVTNKVIAPTGSENWKLTEPNASLAGIDHPLKRFESEIQTALKTSSPLTRRQFSAIIENSLGEPLWTLIQSELKCIELDPNIPDVGIIKQDFLKAVESWSKGDSKLPMFSGKFAGLETFIIQSVLSLESVFRAQSDQAEFVPRQTIREGWLKLSQTSGPESPVVPFEKTS